MALSSPSHCWSYRKAHSLGADPATGPPPKGLGFQVTQGIREVVESPSLEIFQTHLDKVLCSLLWVTLLRQEGWTG